MILKCNEKEPDEKSSGEKNRIARPSAIHVRWDSPRPFFRLRRLTHRRGIFFRGFEDWRRSDARRPRRRPKRAGIHSHRHDAFKLSTNFRCFLLIFLWILHPSRGPFRLSGFEVWRGSGAPRPRRGRSSSCRSLLGKCHSVHALDSWQTGAVPNVLEIVTIKLMKYWYSWNMIEVDHLKRSPMGFVIHATLGPQKILLPGCTIYEKNMPPPFFKATIMVNMETIAYQKCTPHTLGQIFWLNKICGVGSKLFGGHFFLATHMYNDKIFGCHEWVWFRLLALGWGAVQKNAAGWIGAKVVEDLGVPRASNYKPEPGTCTRIFLSSKSGSGGYVLGEYTFSGGLPSKWPKT